MLTSRAFLRRSRSRGTDALEIAGVPQPPVEPCKKLPRVLPVRSVAEPIAPSKPLDQVLVRALQCSEKLYIATTGLRAEGLKELVDTLKKHLKTPFDMCHSLSERTALLLVGSAGTPKHQQAMVRRILCVDIDWAYQGHCDLGVIGDFNVKALRGKSVCSTGLSPPTVDLLKRAVVANGGRYEADLTRRCDVLVVPVQGANPSSEKVKFALANDIRTAPLDQLLRQIDRSSLSQQPMELLQEAHTTSSEKAAIAAETRSVDASVRLSACVVCFTPAWLANARLLHMVNVLGMRRVPIPTPTTTHLVVLGPAFDCVPDELVKNIRVVTEQWIEACYAQRFAVPSGPYRATLPYQPVFTFSGIPPENREHLANAIRALGGRVQDTLVLGRAVSSADGLQSTTHLVIAARFANSSEKFKLVRERFTVSQREECRVVTPEFIVVSAQAGSWVNPAPYAVLNTSSVGDAAGTPRGVCRGEQSLDSFAESVKALPSTASFDRSKGVETVPTLVDVDTLLGDLEEQLPAMAAPLPCLRRSGSLAIDGPSQSCFADVLRFAAHNTSTGQVASQFVVYHHADTAIQSDEATVDNHDADALQQSGGSLERQQPDAPALVKIYFPQKLRDEMPDLDALVHGIEPKGCVAASVAEATHFVTSRPNKTEAFLSALAARLWILTPQYVRDSAVAGRWISEFPYEWTPELLDESDRSSATLCKLILASRWEYRRRWQLPFPSWHVALCFDDHLRAGSFINVMQAGHVGSAVWIPSPSRKAGPRSNTNAAVPRFELPKDTNIVLLDDSVDAPTTLRMLLDAWHALGHVGEPRVLKITYLVHVLCDHGPHDSPQVVASFHPLAKKSR